MSADVLFMVLMAIGLVGSADFFGGIASKKANPFSVAAWSQWVGFPVILVVALAYGGTPTTEDLALGMVAGLGSAIGVVALYRGFSVSAVGIVAPIASTVAAMLPILIGIIGGERPESVVAVGLMVGLVSVVLVGYVPGAGHLSLSGITHGVVSGVGFAMMVVAYSRTSESSGLTSAVSGRFASAVVATVAMLVVGAPRSIERHVWVPTALAGGLAGLGMGFFVAASQRADLILVGMAIALFPAVTVVLAAIFLKEHLARSQWLGIVFAVVAVALISIG
jgi:drug/metabolite transporter (DMT)-like permease